MYSPIMYKHWVVVVVIIIIIIIIFKIKESKYLFHCVVFIVLSCVVKLNKSNYFGNELLKYLLHMSCVYSILNESLFEHWFQTPVIKLIWTWSVKSTFSFNLLWCVRHSITCLPSKSEENKVLCIIIKLWLWNLSVVI